MYVDDGYGGTISRLFGLPLAPSIEVRAIDHLLMVVTYLKASTMRPRLTPAIDPENAVVLIVDIAGKLPQLHIRGKPHVAQGENRKPRAVQLIDLRERASWQVTEAFECVHIYVPMDGLADTPTAGPRFAATRFHELSGTFLDDPVLRGLVGCCVRLFEPDRFNVSFRQHLAAALQSYIGRNLYRLPVIEPRKRGGLSPLQRTRAMELLIRSLETRVTLASIATACNLTTSHFSRAFRISTGVSPGRWRLARRLELACTLMSDPALRLADVSLSCGFADQSHFTRAFSRYLGVTPGKFRQGKPSSSASRAETP